MMIHDEDHGVLVEVSAMLLGASAGGEAVVNSLLSTASSTRWGGEVEAGASCFRFRNAQPVSSVTCLVCSSSSLL